MNIFQCRMARSALRWSLDDLARQSGISRRTIARFELGGRVTDKTATALLEAFQTAGALFINNDQGIGVMLKNPCIGSARRNDV
jgi:transcriptional regulator with XRE-family HTH domain